MLNPHPPLTAFPIALCTLTLGAECLSRWWQKDSCRTFARITLRLLCIFAPITYFSGYWGAENANKTFSIDPEIIASHQALAKFFLISLIPVLALSIALNNNETEQKNPAWLRTIYLGFLWISFILVLLTGAQGGDLVFLHGAGVYAPLP